MPADPFRPVGVPKESSSRASAAPWDQLSTQDDPVGKPSDSTVMSKNCFQLLVYGFRLHAWFNFLCLFSLLDPSIQLRVLHWFPWSFCIFSPLQFICMSFTAVLFAVCLRIVFSHALMNTKLGNLVQHSNKISMPPTLSGQSACQRSLRPARVQRLETNSLPRMNQWGNLPILLLCFQVVSSY